jgi:tetraacyldisaccharide-1-P 4'-kinase
MLCDVAQKHGAQCFVTTEKDLVRLHEPQRARLEQTVPLFAASLTVRLLATDAALAVLEQRLERSAA